MPDWESQLVTALSGAAVTGLVYRLCALAYQRRRDDLEVGHEFRDELRAELGRANERIGKMEQAELTAYRRIMELEVERDGYRNQVLALEKLNQAQSDQIESSRHEVARLEREVAQLRCEVQRLTEQTVHEEGAV